jgi:hypothetical protein
MCSEKGSEYRFLSPAYKALLSAALVRILHNVLPYVKSLKSLENAMIYSSKRLRLFLIYCP